MNTRNQAITELHGRPGQGFGNWVIPMLGKTSIHIQDNLLYIQTKLAFNLESVESYIRLSQISGVTLAQGRIWWLLWLGIPLIFSFFIGVIFIVLFFVIKQKWIIIHSKNTSHICFFKNADSNRAKQFTQTLLVLAQRSALPKPQNRPA